MNSYRKGEDYVDEVKENAFRNGLNDGKIKFLDELQHLAVNDFELQDDWSEISSCFERLKKYVQGKGTYNIELKLVDLVKFGFKFDIIDRIGVLAVMHAPKITKPKDKRPVRGLGSKMVSEEYYADDFEDDEESEAYHEKQIQTEKQRFSVKSTVEEEDFSIEEDIVDETYDRSKSGSSHISIDTKHLHPRVSPEVVHQPKLANNANNVNKMTSSVVSPKFVSSEPTSSPYKGPYTSRPAPTQNMSLDAESEANRAATAGQAVRSSNVGGSKRKGRTASWILDHAWRLGDKIGSGSFGEVFQGLNDKGALFAVKRMNMVGKPSEVDNLLLEIQLMRGLSHAHIVEYLGAWVDTAEGMLYIFQEWVPGGSVAHLLKKFGAFSLGVVREYTRQILMGLEYLHNYGIIHRDIKGGNILVDASRTVKLADFGASTKLTKFDQTQETTTIKGTPYFMAPEVLASSKYGRKGDIWAVGCTMIQMLTGEPPWKDRNLKGLVQLHLLLTSWDQGPPPYQCSITPDARECLELCFKKSEIDRPTALQLLQCKFMQIDELEESSNSGTGFNSTGGYLHDTLEDSGVMTGLKQEMNKAVSRSTVGLHNGGGNSSGGGSNSNSSNRKNDDTMQMIDRQIQEKQQRKAAIGAVNHSANKSNPFGSNNNSNNSNNHPVAAHPSPHQQQPSSSSSHGSNSNSGNQQHQQQHHAHPHHLSSSAAHDRLETSAGQQRHSAGPSGLMMMGNSNNSSSSSTTSSNYSNSADKRLHQPNNNNSSKPHHSQWDMELPSSNFAESPCTPARHSIPVARTPTHSNNSNSSIHNDNSNNSGGIAGRELPKPLPGLNNVIVSPSQGNPFARGVTAVRRPSAGSVEEAAANQYSARNSSSTHNNNNSNDSISNGSVSIQTNSRAAAATNIPNITNMNIGSSNNNNSVLSPGTIVRESLFNLKNRRGSASNAVGGNSSGVGVGGVRSRVYAGRNSGSSGGGGRIDIRDMASSSSSSTAAAMTSKYGHANNSNISSNRDSEDLTPLGDYPSDEEEDIANISDDDDELHVMKGGYNKGNQRRGSGGGDDNYNYDDDDDDVKDANYSNYDTDYDYEDNNNNIAETKRGESSSSGNNHGHYYAPKGGGAGSRYNNNNHKNSTALDHKYDEDITRDIMHRYKIDEHEDNDYYDSNNNGNNSARSGSMMSSGRQDSLASIEEDGVASIEEATDDDNSVYDPYHHKTTGYNGGGNRSNNSGYSGSSGGISRTSSNDSHDQDNGLRYSTSISTTTSTGRNSHSTVASTNRGGGGGGGSSALRHSSGAAAVVYPMDSGNVNINKNVRSRPDQHVTIQVSSSLSGSGSGMVKSASESNSSSSYYYNNNSNHGNHHSNNNNNIIQPTYRMKDTSSSGSSSSKVVALNKKSYSAGVRRASPMADTSGSGATATAARPYTSKAALAGGNINNVIDSSSNNNNRNSNVRPRGNSYGSVDINNNNNSSGYRSNNDSLMPSSNSSKNTSIAPSPSSSRWKCIKCNAINTNDHHCESCATLKGADGKRGMAARVHRPAAAF